jgi:hypothetical protein
MIKMISKVHNSQQSNEWIQLKLIKKHLLGCKTTQVSHATFNHCIFFSLTKPLRGTGSFPTTFYSPSLPKPYHMIRGLFRDVSA